MTRRPHRARLDRRLRDLQRAVGRAHRAHPPTTVSVCVDCHWIRQLEHTGARLLSFHCPEHVEPPPECDACAAWMNEP
jgi:hypothetical protein